VLYSDVLLEAVKSVSLADDDLAALSNDDKKLYAGYLRSAIARFNNNPHVSIGTEKVVVHTWHLDQFGYFARLVRNDIDDNLEPFSAGSGNDVNVSKIKWRGPDGRSLQELPQRLISAIVRESAARPRCYTIVNEKNFFEAGPYTYVVSYAVEENQGIVRVWDPAPLLLLFDRSILFPWEAKPQESENTETGYHDPLEVQIMIPSSHVPYLINLAAVEIANGLNCGADLMAQLKDKLASQERELMRTNAKDRVKTSFSNQDYAANFWARRGW